MPIPYSGVQGDSPPGTIQVPDDYRRLSADPAAFGGATAAADQRLGAAAEQAGGQLFDIAYRQKMYERQAVNTDALNQFQRAGQNRTWGDPNNPSDAGFMGMRGQNALNAYPGFAGGLEQDRQAIMDNIQDPIARQQFDRDSRRLAFTFSEQGARHRQQQVQQYSVDTNNAATSLSLRQAGQSYDNDDAFQHNMADGVRSNEVALRAAGASDAQVQAGVASTIDTFQKQRVLQMAASGPAGVLQASKYLQANLDQFSPSSQILLQNHLRPQVDRANAENGATEALGSAGTAGGAMTRQQFMTTFGPEAQRIAPRLGVAPEVILAHWGQETGWGEHLHDNNVGNIQAGSDWQGATTTRGDTTADGTPYQTGFRAYSTPAQAADDYARVLQGDRYAGARGVGGDALKFGQGLKAGGYMANPNGPQDIAAAAKGLTVPAAQPGGAPASSAPVDGSSSPPDLGAAFSRFNAIADRDGYSFEARRQGEAMLHSEVERQLAVTHDARATLQKQAGDVNAALADGRDVTPIAEDTIRRAFPSDQADAMVQSQREAQSTGWLMQQITFASPDRIREIGADIDSGTGPISNQQRARLGRTLLPAPDGSQPDPNNDPEDYRRRRALGQNLLAALGRRNQMLVDDPAGFVMRDPEIQSVVQIAFGPGATPDQRAAGVEALLKRQAYLGVPEEKRMAMPMAQAAADVHQLQTVDPAKADMGMALSQKAAAYGDAWPSVFASYVRAGLSPEYQALAIMDRPDQTADRADMQRALSVQAAKGGLNALRESVGKDTASAIDKGIDDRMSEFRQSVQNDTNAVKLYDNFRDSVRTLAYYKAMKGDGNALENAYQGVIGKRYDFDGTMRVPKGQLDDAQDATRAALSGLKPEDMPVLRDSTPGLADADKQKQLLASIQARPVWVPMADDGGLQLTVLGHDGTPISVTARGKPVTVRFDQLGKPKPAPATEDDLPDLAAH